MHNLWKGKRGTTLVEILVVMVVLLVGIMTVIQMFPTGFSVVRAGESHEQELAFVEYRPEEAPVGEVAVVAAMIGIICQYDVARLQIVFELGDDVPDGEIAAQELDGQANRHGYGFATS